MAGGGHTVVLRHGSTAAGAASHASNAARAPALSAVHASSQYLSRSTDAVHGVRGSFFVRDISCVSVAMCGQEITWSVCDAMHMRESIESLRVSLESGNCKSRILPYPRVHAMPCSPTFV